MTEEDFNTPYCNTGCVDTRVKPLRALVDWVSITFLGEKDWKKISHILCIDSNEFIVQNKGLKGYQNTVKFGEITICYNENGLNANMGVHLNMSGSACRDYEKLFDYELNWSLFFRTVLKTWCNVTRLDVAIDDFEGYFTVPMAIRNAKRGCMTAHRVKKARQLEEFTLKDGKTDGITFYVGKTDWVIRFYDKLAERKAKDKEVTEKFWNRYEIQLRSKIAMEAMKCLAYEENELGRFVKGFLKAKIDFKVNNKKDSNRSRWESQKWWTNFLDDVEEIPLSQQAPDMTIEKKYKWIDKQVSRSLYMLTEAFPDEETLFEYLKVKGKENIDRNHIREIEDFKNSEVSDIINNDIKNYIQEKKDIQASQL